MTIDDYIYTINIKRKKVGAAPIEMHRRPGSSNPRVETIEVRLTSTLVVLFKSQNFGQINVFLRGMLSGFVNEVLPMPSSKPMDEATHRRLEL
jgi:hypothetical protein